MLEKVRFFVFFFEKLKNEKKSFFGLKIEKLF